MNIRLAICCSGLEIAATSPFHSSTLMGRMTGPTVAKNEKRIIKLQCSDEFKPGGRPTSLLYDTFFESIVFEDAPILKSPFLASLVCSSETDRKIRVNVYYTSSLSGGKETIIAATTFGLREMLRVGKGPFQTDMISEHCASPKAIISVVSTPANPFSSQFFSLSSSTEKNPLSQQYVFYRNDESVPTVICDEITYEPAFPVQVPLAFLQHFSRVLQESILAWEDRCKLERIRQGKFVSIAEAHKHGWHQLRITVLSTRIRSQVDTLSAVTSALLSTTVDECVDDGDIASPPPILLQGTASPVPTRQISSSSVAGTARTASTIEESKPKVTWGTFVEVLLESEGNVFLQRVGRTNSEHSTLEPKYGASVSKGNVNKMQKGGEFTAFGTSEIIAQSVWGAGADLALGGYEGNVYHMMTYVPEVLRTEVRLDLFQEEDGTGKSARMGSCWVPLGRNECKDIWVPVVLVQSYSFSEAEVRVQIEVISGDVNPDLVDLNLGKCTTNGFCRAMPFAFTPASDMQFRRTRGQKTSEEALCDNHKTGSAVDASNKIWRIELPSRDSDDEDETTALSLEVGGEESSKTVPLFGSTESAKELEPEIVLRNCYRWMWDLGFKGCDPLVLPYPEHHIASFEQEKANRVDCPYELPWMANHIKDLRGMQQTIISLMEEYDSMSRLGKTFRKSPLKENIEMQCIPLNFHFQFMVSRRHNSKSDLAEISDFATCGAMSAHGMGYKNGGLAFQEDNLGREKAAIENLMGQYNGQVTGRKNLRQSNPAYALFLKIGARAQNFESETVRVGLRRLFCLSQILSVAVNTLLLKLNLVALGYIDAFFAERWVDKGFPLIFESLLSVSGKEKVMLEDTCRAVEALRNYRVRIVGYSCDKSTEGLCNFEPPLIHVVDREVVLKFTNGFLQRLPKRFSSDGSDKVEGGSQTTDGVVISLVSFLFTLGIDIKQAMATTWENADGNLDFQVGINKRGFALLNDYCHKVMPVDQFAELLHPFVSDFEATLRNPAKMNVDILHEVEKISVMLGGSRVTFCKSGKDRTGMAVTLDQSRQLSEIFGIESSSERVIRDANLMRVYGTRLMVAEKNIGRAVFAINRLQLQFMPAMYRPPMSVLEDVFKASDSS